MPSPDARCAYHPNRPASDWCSQCDQPICAECRTQVAGKVVCRTCVEAIRSRISAEQAAATTVAAPMYVAPARTEPVSGGRILLGILAGAGAGLLGTILWLVLGYFLPFNLSLFAVAIGWAVGQVIVRVGRTGGMAPAVAGGLISLVFIGIGLLLQGYILDFAKVGLQGQIFVLFCLGFGVWEGFNIPMRSGNH